MRRLRAWASRVAGMFSRARRDRELAAELESHLQMHVDDNLRAGMTPDAARRAARLKLGGVEAVKERYRDQRGLPGVDALVQDLRFGARMLVRRPGFTVAAMLTVALGIGPNAAIFSVINAVLLRPLPYTEPDRLVVVSESDGPREISVSYPNYEDWQRQQASFERLAIFRDITVTLTGGGEPERLEAAAATSDLFPALGLAPVAGRAFNRTDDAAGSEPKALLSYRLWQRRFGGSPAIIGRTLVLNGVTHAVVGVMPNVPSVPREAELWTSFGPEVAKTYVHLRFNHLGCTAIGRLKAGVTLEQAQTQMRTIASRLARQYPDANANDGIVVTPMLERSVGRYRSGLLLLFAAVGLVLLIACANLANLLIAHGNVRRQELAMREALGASRRRIARQLLTESALLSLAGGSVGLLLAWWSHGALLALTPQGAPRFAEAHIDWRVCGLALALSLLTGVIAGVWPAWRLSHANLRGVIDDGGRGATDGERRRRLRHALVAGEVAVTLVLLVSAILLVRSLVRLQAVPLGFDPGGIVMVPMDLSPARYEETNRIDAFYQQLLERVRALPGVRGAALNSAAPLDTNWQTNFDVEGRSPFPPGQRPSVEVSVVDPAYFSLMGIPIVQGRGFTIHDDANAEGAIIIDEAFARAIWRGERAVGKRLHFWDGSSHPAFYTVVGIVPTVRLYGYGVEPRLIQAYFAQAQIGVRGATVLVRTAGDVATLVPALRRIVHDLDPAEPVHGIRTMKQDLADSIGSSRLLVRLLALFAVLAVLLASLGLYGVVSYGVSQQTREIGVRLALGAQRAQVLRMVLADGARPALAGIAVGLAAALASARLLGALLYEISPSDPETYVAAAAALIVVTLAACYVPARRATRVDPIEALR